MGPSNTHLSKVQRQLYQSFSFIYIVSFTNACRTDIKILYYLITCGGLLVWSVVPQEEDLGGKQTRAKGPIEFTTNFKGKHYEEACTHIRSIQQP